MHRLMPSEVHPESCLVAFFSTHELVFASASLMVPERTAEALAMVRALNKMTKAGMPESVRIG